MLILLAAGCSAEWKGTRKCDKGTKLIEESIALGSKPNLTPAERKEVRAGLEEGVRLLREGMELLDQAVLGGEVKADLRRYTQAMKAARMKLGELR